MTASAFPRSSFSVRTARLRQSLQDAHPWMVHPDDVDTLEALVAHADVADVHAIVRVGDGTGSWRLAEHRVTAVHDDVVLVAAADVTERERGRDREAQAEAYWRAVLRNSHESVAVVDPVSLRITHASTQLGDLLGRDAEALEGSRAAFHVDRRDLAVVRALTRGWHVGAAARTAELRLRRHGGGTAWTEVVVSDARADDAVGAFVVNIRDIADRKIAEEQLQASEHLFRVLVQHVGDGAIVVDANGAMTFVTERAATSLGATVAELRGRSLEIVPTVDGLSLGHRPTDGAAAKLPTLPADVTGPDGRWFRVVSHDLTDDPVVNATVIVLRDITDGRVRVERLRREVEQDDLTGLLNRRGLVQRLDDHLERGRSVAVGFLDLDGFKAVNDTHGHAAGESVLRSVAARLRRCLRPGDEVARLGGDEFVVVMTDVPAEAELVDITERIVTALVGTYTTDSTTIDIGVSAGWAVAAPGTSAEEALRRADRRMYEQKRRGKD